MSHAPQISNPSLENLLNNVLKNTDIENPRSHAISIEAYQRYIEFLTEAADNTPVSFDTSVTIKVDGKTIRFPNEQSMADFLMELK